MRKKAVIIPDPSLQCGLAMMVAAHRLRQLDVEVTIFHNKLFEIGCWFPYHKILPTHQPESMITAINQAQLCLKMYSDHPIYKWIEAKKKKVKQTIISTFYPSRKEKPKKLETFDKVFSTKLSLAENVAIAIASIFGSHDVSKNNGIDAPFPTFYQIKQDAVCIDRTLEPHVDLLAKYLELGGYNIVYVDETNIKHATFSIYESKSFIGPLGGLAHLASNLYIPTTIIYPKKKASQHLLPCWKNVEIIPIPKLQLL